MCEYGDWTCMSGYEQRCLGWGAVRRNIYCRGDENVLYGATVFSFHQSSAKGAVPSPLVTVRTGLALIHIQ
jgi:hypothetical protein